MRGSGTEGGFPALTRTGAGPARWGREQLTYGSRLSDESDPQRVVAHFASFERFKGAACLIDPVGLEMTGALTPRVDVAGGRVNGEEAGGFFRIVVARSGE